MYLACDAALAMYASGRITGVTVSLGDATTHAVPIYEGTWKTSLLLYYENSFLYFFNG